MIGEIYIGQGKTHNAQYIGQVNKKNTARDKQHFYFHWSGVARMKLAYNPMRVNPSVLTSVMDVLESLEKAFSKDLDGELPFQFWGGGLTRIGGLTQASECLILENLHNDD